MLSFGFENNWICSINIRKQKTGAGKKAKDKNDSFSIISEEKKCEL